MRFLRRKINPSGDPQKNLARIINITKNTVLAERAEIADSFWRRLKGLLGIKVLEPNAGIILRPCTSIHTFFMRFQIDAAFVDNQSRIIKAYRSLPAWRLSAIFFNSILCIELPPGTLFASCTEAGDIVQITPFSA